ncbi:MAG: 16S rRNA (cytidine(1402)-2'-O)-methyltransferase [Thermacetogeniaceae bacterium]
MGELYLCATPLGNLGDVTLRALEVLKQVDLIAAEDTRHTRKLLNHYDIHTPTTSYFEHNRQAKAPLLLAELANDKQIALVTDAGTPGIADPGYQLVQEALQQGHRVTVIPGPSAAIAALVVSGIRPHPFYFEGFLPRKTGERRALLQELAEEARTGVFYEAPHRLQKTLQDFCAVWGGDRQVAVARELTKHFEEVARGTFTEVTAHFMAKPPLGELTIVTAGRDEAGRRSPARHVETERLAGGIAGGDEQAPGHEPATVDDALLHTAPEQIRTAVAALIQAGADTQSACKAVAKALELPKSKVYRLYHL